ncbi:MAG: hypothetical protein JXA30_02875 [Deltaproteobacteria bacterium]|nr:hypothetical protein [Deltaproteobacteria bacterium]
MPTLSGGETTPKERVDVTIGGAARITPDQIFRERESQNTLSYATAGGVTPLFSTRVAVGEEIDLGAGVSGSAAQVEARLAFELAAPLRIIGGLAPYLGWLPLRDPTSDEKGRGIRFGFTTPWVLALSAGGIYEAWGGLCLGLDAVSGSLDENGDEIEFFGYGVRPGVVAGFAVGFRRVYALIELTVNHEWWGLEQNHTHSSFNGFSFLPAFALRLRL